MAEYTGKVTKNIESNTDCKLEENLPKQFAKRAQLGNKRGGTEKIEGKKVSEKQTKSKINVQI